MGTTISKKKNFHIRRSSNNRSHGSMHTQLHQFYKHLKFMLSKFYPVNPFSILHIKCFIIIIKIVVSKLKGVTCNQIIQRNVSIKSKVGIRRNANMSHSAEDCSYYSEWQMNEIIKKLVGSLRLLQEQHQQQQIQGICIIRLISLKIIFKQQQQQQQQQPQHPEQIPEYAARPLEEDHHLQKQRKQLNVEQIQIFVRTLLRILNEKQATPQRNHTCYYQQKEQQQQKTLSCNRYFRYYRIANKIWQLQHSVNQQLSHYHPKLTAEPKKWPHTLFISWRCCLFAFASVSGQKFHFVQYFCIIVYIDNSNNSNNHIHIVRAINSKNCCCCIYTKKIPTSKTRNTVTNSVLVMFVDVVANGIIKYIQETKVQSFAVKKFQLQPLRRYGCKILYKNYNTDNSNQNTYIERDNHSTTIVKELKKVVYNRITMLTASPSAASLSLSAAAAPAASPLVQYNHYGNNSLPSWASHLSSLFPRIFVFLLLLSSLCHGIECFHGSVKLSTNTVKTKYGLVRGTVVRTSPLVEAYLGIPYASPPVGNLRYMPPITPSSWKNLRNADRFSAVCPQTVPIPPNGPEALLEVPRARLAQLRRLLPLLSNQSEDCLYLNLYVPYEKSRYKRYSSTSREEEGSYKLPAILFIHGESYGWNSGNPYDGSELAAHGSVIVVTINFRLGIFGFLKTGGRESAQGNFGLMDLVAGLHWLKENLPAFGGDPQSITLLGHGTGAALANILVVSPVANDLIQRTVLVSGSALTPWAIQKNPLFVKRRVAEQTGCHGDMLYDDLAPCLRTKSVAELLAVEIDHPRFLVGFAPFIDGTVISPPANAIGKATLPLGSTIVSTSGIEYANFPKRNLIFCLTSVESHLDLNAQDLEFGFNETRRDRILRTFVRNNFHYHLNEIFAVVKNEYTDWEKAIRSPLSSRDATLAFLSDGHTASSLIKLGYMHNLRGGKSYFLHFKHRTVEEEYPQRTGSVRGEDVPFWLGLPLSPLFPHNYTVQEKQISHLMLRYLVNFARTGNPNQSSMRTLQPARSTLNNMSPQTVNSTSNENKVTKIKRSSNLKLANLEGMINKLPNVTQEKFAKAAAREALNLAIIYNKRRTKRTHSHHTSDNNADNANFELSSGDSRITPEVKDCPFWDAYDVVNQLYLELGSKAEIQSHYRGHKLSMWLNLIPQLHRHTNMNDLSMRHHQFQDDINHMNLYEGIVRPQPHIKPDDNENDLLVGTVRTTTQPFKAITEANDSLRSNTECSIDGGTFINADLTTPQILADNESLQDPREKDLETSSTALIGNLEVLRRLNSKEFQSYTTALIATVSVGCFLLILNVLIFAGIYHQREKRARDAKTKEELQDNDASKNSSMLKLNTIGSESGSFSEGVAGFSGKSSILFGEYTCYDEKSLPSKDEKLLVDIPSSPTEQLMDPATWGVCNSSTLDLLKAKHHHIGLDNTTSTRTYNLETQMKMLPTDRQLSVNSREKVSCSIPLDSAATTSSAINIILHNKGAAFKGSATQTNQYDFASVQSSDQMSFQSIEDAVKSAHSITDITLDDDIPEPPPPPKSFQSTSTGGILRQAGANSATPSGGKKRVHIQEISV